MITLRLFDPEQGRSGSSSGIAAIVAQYLEDMDARCHAGLIVPEHRDRARRYCLLFQAESPPKPRRGDIAVFIRSHPEWESPHTMHDAATAVMSCFSWAVEQRLIRKHPYKRPVLPACEPRPPISPQEVRLILHHARVNGRGLTRVRFRCMVFFLWQTGARTCEAYRLDWKHYDDIRGCFTLPSKSTTRTGQQRLIVLSRRCWRLVRCLWRWAGKPVNGIVFPNGRSRRWSRQQFARRFRERARGAGVSEAMTAYCLRHGFCVIRLEAGCGERQIADLMGHSSTRFVGYYGKGARVRVDYLRGSLEKK